MKRLPVRWSLVARDDLDRIVDFIAAEAPINALKVAQRIEALARSLEVLPGRGRLVPELASHGLTDWRQVSSPPWRLIYRMTDRRVEVVALLDARRRLDEVLFERLMNHDAEG
jgi:toxin ParE1/3/4